MLVRYVRCDKSGAIWVSANRVRWHRPDTLELWTDEKAEEEELRRGYEEDHTWLMGKYAASPCQGCKHSTVFNGVFFWGSRIYHNGGQIDIRCTLRSTMEGVRLLPLPTICNAREDDGMWVDGQRLNPTPVRR